MASGAGQKYNWYQKHQLHWTCENAATLWLVRTFFSESSQAHNIFTCPPPSIQAGWDVRLSIGRKREQKLVSQLLSGTSHDLAAWMWSSAQNSTWTRTQIILTHIPMLTDREFCTLNFLKLNSAPILFWLTYVGKKENYLFMHGDIDQSWNVPWWTLNLWQKWISHKLFDTTLASSGVFETWNISASICQP